MSGNEIFEIVDENNSVIGKASRSECHSTPSLIHRTSHVIVSHPDGRILLQKRSQTKDIQPGKWDTSVGGHLMPHEDFESAARREMAEELDIPANLPLLRLFDLKIRNSRESENVRVFGLTYQGPFNYPGDEISEIKFWTLSELRGAMETGDIFTPNLIEELRRLYPDL